MLVASDSTRASAKPGEHCSSPGPRSRRRSGSPARTARRRSSRSAAGSRRTRRPGPARDRHCPGHDRAHALRARPAGRRAALPRRVRACGRADGDRRADRRERGVLLDANAAYATMLELTAEGPDGAKLNAGPPSGRPRCGARGPAPSSRRRPLRALAIRAALPAARRPDHLRRDHRRGAAERPRRRASPRSSRRSTSPSVRASRVSSSTSPTTMR